MPRELKREEGGIFSFLAPVQAAIRAKQLDCAGWKTGPSASQLLGCPWNPLPYVDAPARPAKQASRLLPEGRAGQNPPAPKPPAFHPSHDYQTLHGRGGGRTSRTTLDQAFTKLSSRPLSRELRTDQENFLAKVLRPSPDWAGWARQPCLQQATNKGTIW